MNKELIILSHGIARFDVLTNLVTNAIRALGVSDWVGENELHYFRGVGRHLNDKGFDVFQSSVSFAASVERRAGDLKNEIGRVLLNRSSGTKVHIIAHSMGGLDARYMIAKLCMEEKVASLSTIGTPHLGTSFADWGITHKGDRLIDSVGSFVDVRGFADLTTQACSVLNSEINSLEADNPVKYFTYSAFQEERRVFTPLKPSWRIISDLEGENDGLVPVSSQKWCPEIVGKDGVTKRVVQSDFPIPADHLNEVGWMDLSEFNASDFVSGRLLSRIARFESDVKEAYLQIAKRATTC